jgi:hypothetical protein
MAKSINDLVYDAGLNKVHDSANLMTVCNAEPTTRVQAVTTFALADVTMTTADFTVGNGDVSGRKVAVGQKTAIAVDTTGTGNHIALVNSTDLLIVTTTPAQSLDSTANTVTINTWDIEFADPT